MHEVSIAQNIVEIVTETLRQHPASVVRSVRISAGRLSGVDGEALRFALDVVKDGTVLADADFEIECPPAAGVCQNCGREVEMADIFVLCPHCGSTAVQLTSGDQLQILDMEVE
ncbi:MAG: hydrogenase maturation nickel metallochaperone HypA [Acidobacteria bacterium]|nr:hydrogenase maturation nickel metallochaperone HypA [Acidobacteriota bacterium]